MIFFSYLLLIVITVVFWLLPIIDILRSDESNYRQATDRVLWFIIVFFLPPVGGALFLILKPQNPSRYGRHELDSRANAVTDRGNFLSGFPDMKEHDLSLASASRDYKC